MHFIGVMPATERYSWIDARSTAWTLDRRILSSLTVSDDDKALLQILSQQKHR